MVTSRAVASLNAVFVITVPPFGGGTSSTAHRRRASTPWVSRGLQGSKEVQQILFLGVAEAPEATDHAVGFGRPILEVADALVREDRFQQIGRASIVQEEDGRTTDLLEAIFAHKSIRNLKYRSSEANGVVGRFRSLGDAQKQDLLNFLRSL